LLCYTPRQHFRFSRRVNSRTTTQRPGTASQRPGTATQRPGTATQRPGTATQRQGTATQRPGTGIRQSHVTRALPPHPQEQSRITRALPPSPARKTSQNELASSPSLPQRPLGEDSLPPPSVLQGSEPAIKPLSSPPPPSHSISPILARPITMCATEVNALNPLSDAQSVCVISTSPELNFRKVNHVAPVLDRPATHMRAALQVPKAISDHAEPILASPTSVSEPSVPSPPSRLPSRAPPPDYSSTPSANPSSSASMTSVTPNSTRPASTSHGQNLL
jgi:hypothetical protein